MPSDYAQTTIPTPLNFHNLLNHNNVFVTGEDLIQLAKTAEEQPLHFRTNFMQYLSIAAMTTIPIYTTVVSGDGNIKTATQAGAITQFLRMQLARKQSNVQFIKSLTTLGQFLTATYLPENTGLGCSASDITTLLEDLERQYHIPSILFGHNNQGRILLMPGTAQKYLSSIYLPPTTSKEQDGIKNTYTILLNNTPIMDTAMCKAVFLSAISASICAVYASIVATDTEWDATMVNLHHLSRMKNMGNIPKINIATFKGSEKSQILQAKEVCLAYKAIATLLLSESNSETSYLPLQQTKEILLHMLTTINIENTRNDNGTPPY